jgi:hypothetical protein
MNHGTIRVSPRMMASVLTGGKLWLVIPKAVAAGLCVCTAAVESGRARYDCQCMRNSTDGFPSPSTTSPSAVMQSSRSALRLPL